MLTESQRLKMLECPEHPVDMVLDTDAYNEIDDQFAISYALRAKEKLNVKALFAAPFFNEKSSGPADGMEKSYQEILKLLSLSGKTGCCPVFRGSDRYLPDERTPVRSEAARDLAERAGPCAGWFTTSAGTHCLPTWSGTSPPRRKALCENSA